MAARTAEVKAYVLPDVKREAASIFEHWGLSLSDAVNAFLIKTVDVGGFPFALQSEPRPRYDARTVLPVDSRWGSSVLPSSMDDEEDGLYDHLVR